jgi:hypothetical protein
MSHQTKFFAYIKDFSGNSFTIQLEKAGYTGSSSQILYYASSPLIHTYRSGGKEADSVINSSEVTFNFYVESADLNKYDEIFESEYKDWRLSLLKNSNLHFRGWVQPDNLARSFIADAYFISLNATDALIDLKQASFPCDYSLTTGSTTVLDLIKLTLNETDIDLDFEIQVNNKEAHLSTEKLTNGQFTSNINSWSNQSGSFQQDFSYTSTNGGAAQVQLGTIAGTTYLSSKRLRQTSLSLTAQEYLLSYEVQFNTVSSKLLARFLDNSNNTISTVTLESIGFTTGTYTGTHLIPAVSGTSIKGIEFQITTIAAGTPHTNYLNYVSIIPFPNLFDTIIANPNRFVKINNGKIKYTKAYDAIGYLLEPFNSKLFQSEGKYKIVSKNEIDSYIHTINWTTFTAITTAFDRQFDDVSKVLFQSDELSKVRPFKNVDLTFNNLRMGIYAPEYSLNGRFDNNIIGWASGTAPFEITTMDWVSGRMEVYKHYPTFPVENHRVFVESNPVNLYKNSGSTVTINVDINLTSVTYSGSPAIRKVPKFRIELVNNSGVVTDDEEFELISGSTQHFISNLSFSNTEQHTVRLGIVPYSGTCYVTDVTFYVDNFTVFKNNDDSLTKHKIFSGELDTSAIATNEKNIYFGDSDSILDTGALMYQPSGLTSSWSNYGESNSLSLQKLNIYNTLKQNQRFKNYLKLTVKADSINYNHILNIKSKLYSIIGYSFDLANNNLQLELIEYLTDTPTVTYTEEILNGSGDED